MNSLKMKDVDGQLHPATDFAYTPDLNKPSTWKLPIFDMRHVGGAEAAMESDYRGHSAEIPEESRAEVLRWIAEKKQELLDSGNA